MSIIFPGYYDLTINPSIRKLYLNMPYFPRVLTYPTYENLNYNSSVHKRVVNYFYYKLLEKWIYQDDMSKILNFLKVVNGKVVFVSSIKEYEQAKKDGEVDKRLKVNHIAEYFLTKSKFSEYMYKFVKRSNIPWIHLYRNQGQVRRFIGRRLFNKFQESLNKVSRK